nr:DNRLRE domain-containing protein [Actinomadura terrae]
MSRLKRAATAAPRLLRRPGAAGSALLGMLAGAARPWAVGRLTFLGKVVMLLLGAGLACSTLGDSVGLEVRLHPDGGHHAHKRPKQRWGSAAGQEHLVRGPGNRTKPPTLRSRYPQRRPVRAAVPRQRNAAGQVTPPQPRTTGFDEKRSRELPARRGARERAFANPDGTETTAFSETPVNYWNGRAWAPIDTRLTGAGTGWRNRADAVDLRLAGRADESQVAALRLDARHSIGFGLAAGSAARGRAAGSAVDYPDALPGGTGLLLEATPGGVKETLVLRSPDAPRTYVFPLSLTGLTARAEGAQVVLTDETGRRRAVIPAGFMWDSSDDGAASAGVTYRLVTEKGRPALRVDLDDAWLRDPARKYPVRVDPSVASDGADSSMVVHGGGSSSGGSELLVGKKDGAASASYLRWAGLADRLKGHTVYGAQLQVVNFDAASCSARKVTVHPVTQSWSPGSNYSYPGPDVGAAMADETFAYGHIPFGESRSRCPAKGTLFNLGSAGRKLVQGWADGAPANGLSLRASATDDRAWKRFAGSSTANSPTLYVTHSPYYARYSIPSPVPQPPVLQNQAGKVKVTVTNLSAEAWTPSTYYLAYRAYDAKTGKAVKQQRAASLPVNVPRNGKVTLDATIQPMPVGKYFLDFTMVRSGGVVFTDEQVPPGRIVLEVFDIPPVVQELYPPNGYQAQTLAPQLWARAVDIDAPAGSSLQYKFEVCDQDSAGRPVNCTTSAYQSSPAWTPPSGRLVWSKAYQWRAFVKDATSEVPSPRSVLLTDVPQPAVTSHVAGAPYGSQEREFDPQVGNFSTAAVDATARSVSSPTARPVVPLEFDPRELIRSHAQAPAVLMTLTLPRRQRPIEVEPHLVPVDQLHDVEHILMITVNRLTHYRNHSVFDRRSTSITEVDDLLAERVVADRLDRVDGLRSAAAALRGHRRAGGGGRPSHLVGAVPGGVRLLVGAGHVAARVGGGGPQAALVVGVGRGVGGAVDRLGLADQVPRRVVPVVDHRGHDRLTRPSAAPPTRRPDRPGRCRPPPRSTRPPRGPAPGWSGSWHAPPG